MTVDVEEPRVVEADVVQGVTVLAMSDGTFTVGECRGVEAWELSDLVRS